MLMNIFVIFLKHFWIVFSLREKSVHTVGTDSQHRQTVSMDRQYGPRTCLVRGMNFPMFESSYRKDSCISHTRV